MVQVPDKAREAVINGNGYTIAVPTEYADTAFLFQLGAATINGQEVIFRPTEGKLFYYLFSRMGRDASTEEIYKNVFRRDEEDASLTNEVAVYVNYIRRKLKEVSSCPFVIQSVRNVGYKMVRI